MSNTISSGTCPSPRHTTHYLQAGDSGAPLIIFIHGWPELSLSWRHQLPFIAALGYHAVAPDMRGYGGSSQYRQHADYALSEAVADMLELLDHLGQDQAIWVGHDWGSPVVWSLARHHPHKCRAVANLCVPYDTLEKGWEGFLPHVDRSVYPEDQFPAGQWEYMRYYEEHFAQATALFDTDPYRLVKALFRRGSGEGQGQPSVTAYTRINNGWFDGVEIPDVPRDADVVTEQDLQTYAAHLKENSFFGPDSWYMNHAANAAYSAAAEQDQLDMPVLFLHGRYDYTCETVTSSLAEPMRGKCSNLTEHIVDSGHWMAQEQPDTVNQHLAAWLPTVA